MLVIIRLARCCLTCNLIASIHNNSGKLMVVSTRNNGAIADLPFDCIVEVSDRRVTP